MQMKKLKTGGWDFSNLTRLIFLYTLTINFRSKIFTFRNTVDIVLIFHKLISVFGKPFMKIRLLLFPLALIIFLSSCTTIKDTIYVQDVNVKGLVTQPPLNITVKDTASFTISPKFFINTKKSYNGLIEGHTKVNSSGFFQIDTIVNGNEIKYTETPGANVHDFKGENLHWSIPDYFISVDVDLPLSRRVVLSGGFNLSSKDKTNLYGYRAGLGFIAAKDNIGLRIDGGIIIQKYTFEAASVIIRNYENSESQVYFFMDKESSTNINGYFSLTLNTYYENFPVNFLLNAGYSGQSLIDYSPADPDNRYYIHSPSYRITDLRGEAFASFVNLSPGFYAKINNWVRFVFAVRFFFELDIEDSESSNFIIPMMQLDLNF